MPRTRATIHAKYTVQTWQGKVPKHNIQNEHKCQQGHN